MSDIRDGSWFGVSVVYDNNIPADYLDLEVLHFIASKGGADSELIFTIGPL